MPTAGYADLDALRAELTGHGGCGFEPCETAMRMVPGDGHPNAEVMLIGEAPGASEDAAGRPFVGRAGKFLDSVLEHAGLNREQVYVTNVVKARPPDNRDPKPAEVAHCLPWLLAELELVRPLLVVPLGRHALAHFVKGHKITAVAGTLVRGDDGRALFPLLHPAAALRSPARREQTLADAARLPGVLAGLRESAPAPAD